MELIQIVTILAVLLVAQECYWRWRAKRWVMKRPDKVAKLLPRAMLARQPLASPQPPQPELRYLGSESHPPAASPPSISPLHDLRVGHTFTFRGATIRITDREPMTRTASEAATRYSVESTASEGYFALIIEERLDGHRAMGIAALLITAEYDRDKRSIGGFDIVGRSDVFMAKEGPNGQQLQYRQFYRPVQVLGQVDNQCVSGYPWFLTYYRKDGGIWHIQEGAIIDDANSIR